MLKISIRKNVPKITLVLICAVFVLTQTLYADRTDKRRSRTTDRGTSELRDQKIKEQQEKLTRIAEDAAKQIDSKLVNILKLVNKNKKPNSEKITAALQTVTDSAKFLSKYGSKIQCQHYMLKAWTDYFNDNPKTANQAAKRAYRTDQDNNDAYITQAAIAVLTDNKPTIKKPTNRTAANLPANTSRRQQRTSSKRRQTTTPATTKIQGSAGMGSGKILQLDVEAIKPDMLGKKIQPLKINCINATTLNCDPAQTNLCIMFWQLPESLTAADPNDPSQEQLTTGTPPGQPGPNMMIRPDMMRPNAQDRREQRGARRPNTAQRGSGRSGEMMPSRPDMMRPGNPPGTQYMMPYNQQSASQQPSAEDSLESEMAAFGKLFNSQFDNPLIKFVAVNTDPPKAGKEVVEKLLQNPWPWAQVMASNPTGGAEQFQNIEINAPALAIVNKDATIKYAGPAAGFLAPMVLERSCGITLTDTEKSQQPADSNSMPEMSINIEEALKQLESNPELLAKITSDDDMLTPEQFQAEKLLNYAEGLFGPAAKKGAITYKQTVELCRQIMNQYPNTPYAEKARQLLRQIPEPQRKRYKITNEELGL